MARKKIAATIENALDGLEISSESYSVLLDIEAATKTKGYAFYNPTGLEELVNNALIEFNYDLPNKRSPKQFAARITEKGINTIMAKKNIAVENTSEISPATAFAVGAFNPAAVKPKAPGAKRGRESKYHLDRLDIGQFVFVPCTNVHATSDVLVKSLAGTVQASNKKFAIETGETRVMKRKVKNSDEVIEKTVPVLSYTRKFAAYPYAHEGVDGAALVREA